MIINKRLGFGQLLHLPFAIDAESDETRVFTRVGIGWDHVNVAPVYVQNTAFLVKRADDCRTRVNTFGVNGLNKFGSAIRVDLEYRNALPTAV
ncbi:MAG: hypothetical protein AB3N17_11485 [Tateyamaria sp.]